MGSFFLGHPVVFQLLIILPLLRYLSPVDVQTLGPVNQPKARLGKQTISIRTHNITKFPDSEHDNSLLINNNLSSPPLSHVLCLGCSLRLLDA